MAGRILGLDYGSKTVGVAVTDGLGLTAVSLETICRDKENHLRSTYRRIQELVSEYQAEKIVLGLPLNMDGTEGERARLTRDFGEELGKRTGCTVIYQDERLTTEEAAEIMRISGTAGKNPKDRIDAVAAAVILTDHLRGSEGN